jgi:hypothetical protein
METDSHAERPSSRPSHRIGDQRYWLIRDAFAHAQRSIVDESYLEAISVLESIMADRLGSLLHGSLGARVKLRDTVGNLIAIGTKNVVIPRPAGESGRTERKALPSDVVEFINIEIRRWWAQRNQAVHAMAKLREGGDLPFDQRYASLRDVAIAGVVLLRKLSQFDIRERRANGAGRAATEPNALELSPEMNACVSGFVERQANSTALT